VKENGLMPKKYIKGKDGKFKGSLPDPYALPKSSPSNSLPQLPNAITTATVSAAQPEVGSSFYCLTKDIEFKLPPKIASQIEKGDLAYFKDEHILYTDSYGDNNAAHYPYFPMDENQLIDLTSEENKAVAENIANAVTFEDLTDDTKDYFKNGGCAALAVAIHEKLPGSKLGIVIGAMLDDPSDATAAHVYVSKDGKIFDAFGVNKQGSYDYANAAGINEDFMEALAYDTTHDAVKSMISHGCFSNEFHSNSEDLIGKVAELVIQENK
jgi:hypothetical protein